MLKLNYSSLGHRNYRESMTRALNSIRQRMKRNALPIGLSALALVALAQSGCGSSFRNLTNDLNNNLLVEYRDAVWSRRAYNLRYGNCDRPYSSHYRDGFCAGYMDVCNGGDGYVPALPPSEYRGYEYQCAEGAKCVNTWFEGYPAGVAAAKQDKSGDYKDMFISKMINSAVTQENAKHLLPGDVPIVNAKKDEDSGVTTNEAPPLPEVTSNTRTADVQSDVSLAGPAVTSDGNRHFDPISIIETVSSDAPQTNSIRPALPPIVKGRSAQNQQPSQVTSARPSAGSPQPLPMARQANASVITNQFVR